MLYAVLFSLFVSAQVSDKDECLQPPDKYAGQFNKDMCQSDGEITVCGYGFYTRAPDGTPMHCVAVLSQTKCKMPFVLSLIHCVPPAPPEPTKT